MDIKLRQAMQISPDHSSLTWQEADLFTLRILDKIALTFRLFLVLLLWFFSVLNVFVSLFVCLLVCLCSTLAMLGV